jgi:hypothetical protein
MSDNTDNPAFPIIEFLNEKIKEAEESKDHWELNSQKPLADYYRKVAVNRIAAFKEVFEFIEETFKPE